MQGEYRRYRNGRLREKGMYANGKRQGLFLSYHQDGKTLQREVTMQYGKIDGMVKTWFSDEKPDMLQEYRPGKRNGREQRFDPKSDKQFYEANYTDDRKEEMRQLAEIPRYQELVLGDSASIHITREQAAQASGRPYKSFAIGNLKAAIQSIPLMSVFLKGAIPENVRGEIIRRIFSVFPTLINKEVDVKTIALFSVPNTEDVFLL